MAYECLYPPASKSSLALCMLPSCLVQATSAVEALASLILRSRLRQARSVEVEVDSDGPTLLQVRPHS